MPKRAGGQDSQLHILAPGQRHKGSEAAFSGNGHLEKTEEGWLSESKARAGDLTSAAIFKAIPSILRSRGEGCAVAVDAEEVPAFVFTDSGDETL